MKISTLAHTVFHRKGSTNQHESFSCDFTVNGHSLHHMLDRLTKEQDQSDLIGCFMAGMNPDLYRKKFQQLLCIAPPEIPSGRVMLYVCPECADLGCGAYTMRIAKDAQFYKWYDFAYENGYEEPAKITRAGPFMFEANAYEKAIEDAMI